MLECIYHVRPTYPSWDSPEDTVFTMTVRNNFVREVSAPLKSSVVALFCRSEIMVGTAITELGSLNAVETMGSWSGQGQWQDLITKGEVGGLPKQTMKSKQ